MSRWRQNWPLVVRPELKRRRWGERLVAGRDVTVARPGLKLVSRCGGLVLVVVGLLAQAGDVVDVGDNLVGEQHEIDSKHQVESL